MRGTRGEGSSKSSSSSLLLLLLTLWALSLVGQGQCGGADAAFLTTTFSSSSRRSSSWFRLGGARRGSSSSSLPPPSKPPSRRSIHSEDDSTRPSCASMILLQTFVNETSDKEQNEEEALVVSSTSSRLLRGGSTSSSSTSSNKNPSTTENVVKGTRATLANTANFWSRTFASIVSLPKNTFQRLFRSKQQQQEEALLQQLQTMPVQRVHVPNSTVLPHEVVQVAAKRSGMLGQPLSVHRVQELARTLQRWYQKQGYVLHSVTGATLKPETATAEIAVQEPKIHAPAVDIIFCKEMIVDPQDENKLWTFRQYKDYRQQQQQDRRRSRSNTTTDLQQLEKDKQSLNTTFIETTGRTNPQRIAHALGLQPGAHFAWHADKWRNIQQSGIFQKILRASPQPMGDGTVQLQIYCQEAPPRHLEYGVGKSLYTNAWEGEVEFEHLNLLGGGETLGVTVKRGTQDVAPSVRVTFTNPKFGMAGGYNVQVFRDYLGGGGGGSGSGSDVGVKVDQQDKSEKIVGETGVTIPTATTVAIATEEESAAATIPTATSSLVVGEDDDEASFLFDRKGLSFRIKNPIPQRVLLHSAASATIERTSTTKGSHENIASTTVSIGPFLRQLPFDARSNVDATLTTGTRICTVEGTAATTASASSSSPSSLLDNKQFLPYSSVTATTKQIFPLTQLQQQRPLLLAMRHSITTSSRHTPLYEAKALGNAANIRGAEPNSRVKSCLRGTTELRVPVPILDLSNLLPKRTVATALSSSPPASIRQDANIVLFGDWLIAAKDAHTPLYRKTAVGIGLRKTIQGIPLQLDLTYNKDLKFKTAFGLGRDFDV